MDDYLEKSIEELGPDFPHAVVEMDLKGFLVRANKACYDLFAYSLDYDITTLNARDVIDESDHERAMANIHKVMFNRVLGKNEYLGVKSDGTRFPIFIHSMPMKHEGSTIGMRAIVEDISKKDKD